MIHSKKFLVQILATIGCSALIFLICNLSVTDENKKEADDWLTLHREAIKNDNTEFAEKLVKVGIANKFSHAYYALAWQLTPTDRRTGNWHATVRALRDAARLEHPDAQYRLAIAYQQGIGIAQDVRSYLYWIKKAANNNHRKAQGDLADHLFDESSTIASDHTDAIYWYNRAADNGDISSMRALGLIFIDEDFGLSDPKIALRWFFEAAGKGDAESQFWMGVAWVQGIGPLDADLDKGISWWKKAADQDYEQALVMLGRLANMELIDSNSNDLSF